MEWEFIAPMIVAVTVTLSAAGVFILRPLTKRLGDVIDVIQRRQQMSQNEVVGRIAELLEHLDTRLDQLEHRQEFSERMLSSIEGRTGRQSPPLRDSSKS